jgi:hypothetical protein
MATESKDEEPQRGPLIKNIVDVNDDEIERLFSSLCEKHEGNLEFIPCGEGVGPMGVFRITKESLKHAFGMKLKRERKLGNFVFTGFHHIDLLNIPVVESFMFRNFGPHVTEGYIVVNKQHLPVYKTFFRASLSREDIVSRVVEAIQNITFVITSAQGKNWEVVGQSKDGISIQIVADKGSGAIITFFPFQPDPKEKQDIKKKRIQYQKTSFNPCYSVAPWKETDANKLQQVFGRKMYVGLKFVEMDVTSIEYYDRFRAKPCKKYGLLTQANIDFLRHEMPFRDIQILHSIDDISLPLETIQRLLIDTFHRGFPENMSQREVITKLKEAIENYQLLLADIFQETIWEDVDSFDETPKEELQAHPFMPIFGVVSGVSCKTGTSWDYFGGEVFPSPSLVPTSKHALDIMFHEECDVGGIRTTEYSIPSELPVPSTDYFDIEKVLYLRAWSGGTCFMDTWLFRIRLDPLTGEIRDF